MKHMYLMLVFSPGPTMTGSEWEGVRADIRAYASTRMLSTGGELVDVKTKQVDKKGKRKAR